ncbi:MAG TPA: hypothetical protein VIK89_11730 [Cytophagaceae bacterium]
MRKLSNLFIIFAMASIAFLSSCGNDDEPVPGPTLSFIAGSGLTTGDTEVEPGETLKFLVLADKGDKNLKSFTVTQGSFTLTGFPKDISGSQYKDTITIVASDIEGTYTYNFTVTSNDDQTATKSVKVTVKKQETSTPLGAATSGEWKREGSNEGTGLSTFGLSWTSNSGTSAIVKKDAATKFVKLAAGSFTSITTKEGLKEAIDNATAITQYEGVSAAASNNSINDVLGTIHNGTYYMILVESSTVSTGGSGTVITIKIQSKN